MRFMLAIRRKSARWGRFRWLAAALALPLGACTAANQPDKAAAASRTDDRQAVLKRFAGEFVDITPGRDGFPRTFEMGAADKSAAERPVHAVEFNSDFAIARYEVTQELYRTVMGTNPSVWQGPERDRNSCEMMTWEEAVEFCHKVTALLHAEKLLDEARVVRLPTEAQWEYCCRAGTTTAYSFGDYATEEDDDGLMATRLDAYAWHTGNAAGNDPSVGVLEPNAWGLYDMHGYLWEYVLDAWHDDYTGAPADGSAWEARRERVRRVIRGGSWRDAYGNLRSGTRWPIPDHVRSDAIGFRCVIAKK